MAAMTENEAAAQPVEANLAPWLPVTDGPRAVAYYQAAFGAVERYRLEDDAGRVVVARLAIGEADFWVQEDLDSGPGGGGGPIRMILTVADPDAVFRQAVAAGATEIAPVSDEHGWHVGRLADPFGYHWEVGRPLPDGPG
jgi:PhnB protein